MANSKISALPAVTTPASTDEFAVNQIGTTKKMTRAQVHTLESGEFLQGTTGAGLLDLRGDSGASLGVRVKDDGTVLLGTTTSSTASPRLDILNSTGYLQLRLKQAVGGDQRMCLSFEQFTAAEEGFGGFGAFANASVNRLFIGGGIGGFNACNEIKFYTAADQTTLTGTLVADITGVGATSTLRTAGHLKCDAVFRQATVTTLADDATPTVAASNLFITGGATTITDFDNGVVGQTIKILAAHSVTITHGAPIILNGAANYDMTDTDTLTLTMYNDQVWSEDARSVN